MITIRDLREIIKRYPPEAEVHVRVKEGEFSIGYSIDLTYKNLDRQPPRRGEPALVLVASSHREKR